MQAMNRIVDRYCDRAVFAFVYILEAHASDEWPVPCSSADILQHTSTLDRALAARRLQVEYPLHPRLNLLLDNTENEFNSTYASWPFRYWIIRNGRVELKLMPEGDQTSMKPLEDWLRGHFGM